MSAGEDAGGILAHRRRKLAALRAAGEAYPNAFRRGDWAADLLREHGERSKEELEQSPVRAVVAGRVMLRRAMGKASFLTLEDPSGRIQCYLRRDELGADAYQRFRELWDLGDIVGIEGRLMKTNRGELTVQASAAHLLSKALRPLPEKFHGLSDREARYRQRYLDLIASPDSRAVFKTRARLIAILRAFFDDRGYLEVETPMMHPIPGGAAARPFVTRHNGLGMDLYMRVAPELYLKRLLVGGFERVYEINRCFRNEGLSPRHNPEFTTIEFYEAFADYENYMDLTDELMREVTGGKVLSFEGRTLDFRRIARRTMADAVAEATGTAPEQLRDADRLAALARGAGIDVDPGWGWGSLLMALFEARVEPNLIEPTFIIGYPAEVSPLSRRNADDPQLVDRFELFAAGREIANGFSELNDPDDQAQRFREQARRNSAGDDEAMRYDQDFVTALEYGMPPAAGEGIGIDRLAMLLTGCASIRDVLLFPQMRPPQGGDAP